MQLQQLESTKPSYEAQKALLQRIEILYKGGALIEQHKHLFLPRRIEEEEIYQLRLNRFTYTNLLSDNIQKILTRFNSGQIQVTGENVNSLTGFRNNIDSDGCGEKAYLNILLRNLLIHQCAYIRVDKPYSDIEPVNAVQERQLGLDPYLVSYTPLDVINEDVDGKWFKIRTLHTVNSPFGETYHKVVWTIIDEENVSVFESLVELGKDGEISSFISPSGGQKRKVTPDADVPLLLTRPHGFSRCPVIKLSLPGEKYAAGQSYLKVIQYLNVENSVTDTAISAGYVQRVMTPIKVEDNPYQAPINQETVKSDNQHILVANSFKFEEMEGKSIKTGLDFLDKIRDEIRDIICLSAGSTNKESLTRAAASKKLDDSTFEVSLQAYGSIITSYYQKILKLVLESLGLVSSDLSVTGLDAFETDTLNVNIETAIKLKKEGLLEDISPTAWTSYMNNISVKLNPNISPQTKELIISELVA